MNETMKICQHGLLDSHSSGETHSDQIIQYAAELVRQGLSIQYAAAVATCFYGKNDQSTSLIKPTPNPNEKALPENSHTR